MELPAQARIAVIGAGVLGCAVAYHLARLGGEVVLLTRGRIGAAPPRPLAGLVGQLHGHMAMTRLLAASARSYAELGAQVPGLWQESGALHVATTPGRWQALRRLAGTARALGVEAIALSPAELRGRWPELGAAAVLGAVFLPEDGVVEPGLLARTLATGAQAAGAKLFERCAGVSLVAEGGRLRAVQVGEARLAVEAVVLCAGAGSRGLAAQLGVGLPLAAVRQLCAVLPPLPAPRPALYNAEARLLLLARPGGVAVGGAEAVPKPWSTEVPGAGPETAAAFSPLLAQAVQHLPGLAGQAPLALHAVPEIFTPDGLPLLGEAPAVRGLFMATGCGGAGAALAGGAGRALAEWVLSGVPPAELWGLDPSRFGAPQGDPRWVRARAAEAASRRFVPGWADEDFRSARPLRRSPLYPRLRVAGARFGEKMGFERPNWFSPPVERDIGWLPSVAREHRNARDHVDLFDTSSQGKFLLLGDEAEALLASLCATEIARAPGQVARVLMLNEAGGVQAKLHMARLAPDEFYLVCGTASTVRDADWILRHMGPGRRAKLVEMSAAYAVLALVGPEASALLQALVAETLDEASFPFGTARRVFMAGALVLAMHLHIGGLPAWELHVPADYALTLFDALVEDGVRCGLRPGGYHALETLRLEAGLRAWGRELTPEHTPLEAGLRGVLRLDEADMFVGRAALLAQAQRPLKKRLLALAAGPDVLLVGGEPILRNGLRVGLLTSGGFGHATGRALGMGYVRNAYGVDEAFLAGRYELEVAGALVPAQPLSLPALNLAETP